jgi:hypothetical protein
MLIKEINVYILKGIVLFVYGSKEEKFSDQSKY